MAINNKPDIHNLVMCANDGTVFTTNRYEGFEDGICELNKAICRI